MQIAETFIKPKENFSKRVTKKNISTMFRQKSEPSTSKDESWASPYHRVQTDRVTSRFEFFVGFLCFIRYMATKSQRIL